ncbi:hypothetical protein [Streptomyces sp. NPDC096105]|uniref:hypothetical protein n=1 Tax=Streptomyces sp. NPDC096105 TaxID=3366074 RepID=UPI0038085910
MTPPRARRPATAPGALLTGPGRGVVPGLAPRADERCFAGAARDLASGAVLTGHGTPAPGPHGSP